MLGPRRCSDVQRSFCLHVCSAASLGAAASGGAACRIEVVDALWAMPDKNNRLVSNPSLQSRVFVFGKPEAERQLL